MLRMSDIRTLLLIRNRPGNVFSSIPKKLIIQYIGGINPKNALDYVINTDYKKLFTILSCNPALMFMTAKTADINGDIIEKSPLEYALYALDSYAYHLFYKICYKTGKTNPSQIRAFQDQVRGSNDHINLNTLREAYTQYIQLFEQYVCDKVNIETLKTSWFNVGKAQGCHLPRHMLRSFCFLPVSLQPASHHIVLLSLCDNNPVTDTTLDEIAKKHQCWNILIKQEDKFFFCKFNFCENKWRHKQLLQIPFKQIDFPKYSEDAKIKDREKDLKNNFVYNSYDYYAWTTATTIPDDEFMQDAVFANINGQFDELSPSLIDLKLGIEFTLARGNSAFCFAVDNPTGHHQFLKYKAADDLRSFQILWEKKVDEKQLFLTKMKRIDMDEIENSPPNHLSTPGSKL